MPSGGPSPHRVNYGAAACAQRRAPPAPVLNPPEASTSSASASLPSPPFHKAVPAAVERMRGVLSETGATLFSSRYWGGQGPPGDGADSDDCDAKGGGGGADGGGSSGGGPAREDYFGAPPAHQRGAPGGGKAPSCALRNLQAGPDGWTMIPDTGDHSTWQSFTGGMMAMSSSSPAALRDIDEAYKNLNLPKLHPGETRLGFFPHVTLVGASDPSGLHFKPGMLQKHADHLRDTNQPAGSVVTGVLVLTTFRIVFQATSSAVGSNSATTIYDCPLGCVSQLCVNMLKSGSLKRHRKALYKRKNLVITRWESFTLEAMERGGGFAMFGLWGVDANFVAHQVALLTAPKVPLSLMPTPEPDARPPAAAGTHAVATVAAAAAAAAVPPAVARAKNPLTRLLREYQRMGVIIPSHLLPGDAEVPPPPASFETAWRISEVNRDFNLCPTYPELVATPCKADDSLLRQSAAFRARGRIPVLSYRDPATGATITRCSQPLVGMLNKRSKADERLVSLIACSNRLVAEDAEKDAAGGGDPEGKGRRSGRSRLPFYIMDLRPLRNALANQLAHGGGHESSHYAHCEVLFCGIQNIHVVLESLQRVQQTARQAHGTVGPILREDPSESSDDDGGRDDAWGEGCESNEYRSGPVPASVGPRQKIGHLLAKVGADSKDTTAAETKWLHHLGSILAAAMEVVAIVADYGSSVLVHCSDGWDRTPQVTSLSQLLLDPYSRTYTGFSVLIEKEWVSMGHQFCTRASGLRLSSDIEVVNSFSSGAFAAAQAAASSPTTACEEDEAAPPLASCGEGKVCGPTGVGQSPTFIQWLACVAQVMEQHPQAFEFTKTLLWLLADDHCSGRHCSFVGNSDQDRVRLNAYKKSQACPWSALFADHHDEIVNTMYDPTYCNGPLRDVDCTLRHLEPWILPPAQRQNVTELQRQKELENQSAELNGQLKLQQEENQRLQNKIRTLESRYTEDVGHRPVEVRESHPGGRTAMLQPILREEGGKEIVAEVRDADEEALYLDDEDSNLVLISHVYQQVCKQSRVNRTQFSPMSCYKNPLHANTPTAQDTVGSATPKKADSATSSSDLAHTSTPEPSPADRLLGNTSAACAPPSLDEQRAQESDEGNNGSINVASISEVEVVPDWFSRQVVKPPLN